MRKKPTHAILRGVSKKNSPFSGAMDCLLCGVPYMCVCIYTFVSLICIYVHVCIICVVYLYVCVFICLCSSRCICVCFYVCTCESVVPVCVCLSMCLFVYVYVCVNVASLSRLCISFIAGSCCSIGICEVPCTGVITVGVSNIYPAIHKAQTNSFSHTPGTDEIIQLYAMYRYIFQV